MKNSAEHQVDNTTIVDLSGLTPIAKGTKRKLFIIPERPDFIVKVFRFSQTPAKRRKRGNKRKLPWLRSTAKFDQNKADLRELTKLGAKCGRELWQFFPQTEGFIDTTLGPGLMQIRVMNCDGTSAQTLTDYLIKKKPVEPVLEALEDFKQFLSRHHIVIQDLTTNNLMVRQAEDGSVGVVMIDGFVNSEYIQISTFFRFFNEKKLERKFGILKTKMKNLSR